MSVLELKINSHRCLANPVPKNKNHLKTYIYIEHRHPSRPPQRECVKNSDIFRKPLLTPQHRTPCSAQENQETFVTLNIKRQTQTGKMTARARASSTIRPVSPKSLSPPITSGCFLLSGRSTSSGLAPQSVHDVRSRGLECREHASSHRCPKGENETVDG